MNKIEFINNATCNLSEALISKGFTFGAVNKLLKNKDIKINGIRQSLDAPIKNGDVVTVFTSDLPTKKYEIVFEDKNIYIINKKKGIEVTGSLGLEGQIKNAIAVHRLDRNTEGLLVMAKNKEAEQALLSAFKNKTITKKYLCEVFGKTTFRGNTYSAYLLKDQKSSTVKIFDKRIGNSVTIQTNIKTIKNNNDTSLLEIILLTGKTHQIRAHLAFLGFPIVGDEKYGNPEKNKLKNEKSQKLHCFFLQFDQLPPPLSYLNGKSFTKDPSWQ